MVDQFTRSPLLIATLLFITFGKHLLALLAVSVIHFSPGARKRVVYALPLPRKQIVKELSSSWTIFLDGVVFFGLLYFGIFRFQAQFEWGTFILHYLCIFLFFELWFFYTHIAMHKSWLRKVHQEHHRSHVVNPLSGLQFSFSEKTILTLGSVGFIAVFSQFQAISLHSVLLFFVIYYANSLIGHSNVEIQPSNFGFSVMGKVFTSPTYHALHHARYRGHYGLTITLLDRLNGSIFPDYTAIHRRVARGEGLTQLSQHLSS